MTTAKKSRLAGGLCIAGATGVAAAAVALLGPAASGATKAGGDSTGSGSANGGSGGSPSVVIAPVAQSGNSGDVHAESSATNTGNTGPATSTAISNPVAITGNSGSTGGTGSVHSTQRDATTSKVTASRLSTDSSGLSASIAAETATATTRSAGKVQDAVARIDSSSGVSTSTGTTSTASETSAADPQPAPPAPAPAPEPSAAFDAALLGFGVATNSADAVAGSHVRNA